MDDQSLRALLGQWNMTEPLPPHFQERVWRRIEQAHERSSQRQDWRSWLESVFARRSVALAYISVLLLFGVAAGYANGQAHEHRLNSQLAAKYVQSLDPYQRNHE